MAACIHEIAGDRVEDWFRQPPAWEATHSDLQARMAEKPQRPPAHPVVKEPPQRAAQRPTIGVATIHKHPPKQRGRGMGAPDVIPYTQWQQAAAWGAPRQSQPSPISALAYSKAGMPSKSSIVPAPHKEAQLCTQCRLPIGEFGYDVDIGDGAFLHGECAAQLMQQRAREDEKLWQKKDAMLKKKRRAENDIGWKIEHIPLNSVLAGKLGCRPVSNNMVCLVQAEGRHSVHPAPTADPAACVNLEYLSLALQVRRREGREPLFSLDPKDTAVATADNPKALWQVKRFEPEWLAGTSIGEVMFQADVYLKELSMGEHAQPVAGMKSCLDYSQDEDGAAMEWSAREWFVVKRAEIQMTQGGALVPCVEMGVEAREMVATPDGLEDAWITWSDHPCVKYADAFTHYFDVIAERKSVIYYLRELAKASALAKHLVDADVCLEESWFNIEGQVNTACSLEIPQLWHERLCSQIHVKNGKIVEAESRPGARIHGVYGGIEFGLERAQVTGAPAARAAPVAPPGAIAQVGVPTRQVGPKLTIAQGKITKQAGLLAIPQDTISYATHAGQPAARLDPRGVDLNLNQFDLSAATQIVSEQPGGKTGAAGNAFWASMRGECDSVFDEKDTELFKKLFNSSSDRRDEGDLFVPPDPHPQYMQKLAGLLEEEERVRRERSDHFFSEAFAASDPGPLFPSSWMSTVSVQGDLSPEKRDEMQIRPDYYARIEQMLKSSSLAPTFDKSTEDGARFRIYKVGTLEARTIQEQDGNEVIGVVFARCAKAKAKAGAEAAGAVEGHEQVVGVSEYVEWTHDGARSAAQHGGRCSPQFQRYYILLETEKHNVIATERLADGTVTWAVNPSDQEARNFLARVVRSATCSGIAVQDFQRYHAEQAQDTHLSAPSVECKRYADGVYGLALPARADHGRP